MEEMANKDWIFMDGFCFMGFGAKRESLHF